MKVKPEQLKIGDTIILATGPVKVHKVFPSHGGFEVVLHNRSLWFYAVDNVEVERKMER